MNVLKFQILVLIDKYNKVTDVAKELDMKQPTVTFHMKSLEKDMNTSLYTSQQGRIVLTDAGRAILPHAKQMLALTDVVRRTVQQYSSLEQGNVHIKADILAAENVLPLLMNRFASEYPGIEMKSSLVEDCSGEGNIEGSLLLARSEKQTSNVDDSNSDDYILLQQDQLMLVYAENHPLMMNPSIKPGDLSGNLFVDYESQGLLGKYTELFTERTNVHLWKRVTAATPQAALRAVHAGNAITFLPSSMLTSPQSNVIAVPIPGLEANDTRVCTYLYRRKNLSPAASAFWNYIKSIMHPSHS
ncbi:LysR family transcriptional regulator [Paenibacillus sp. Marseille-Q4541]|uniref:LysR family transcriptional regulator n=1 Tax=Paenibacillus sp. Marseille-Q4541 TaxID=2831522 RepID=UPI001BA6AB05|nr:LysR family transcriptional regulator [Paenibacillus sp. Marseille-Q4541]